MKAAKSIDFARTVGDYAEHRAAYPRELYQRLERFEVGVHQQKVLDLGTGTGALARGFAQRGCEVVGVDTSEELLVAARDLDRRAKVAVDYHVAKAERTRMPSGQFDVVSAGQSWHWFKRGKAAREARRLLVPSGRLVIVHFDWLPLPDTVAEATEELILRYNHRWALARSTGLYPQWLTDVRVAGFGEVETFSFDVDVPYSHRGWRGRVRASSGVGASMSRGRVVRFDEKLRLLLLDRFPDDPLVVSHRVWAVICRSSA
ncbi:MAG: methyltransferase domain-containing protein [Deltaproteobacteria bacterium]|jgi:ubiquinone/menaquinone biosynthesis C-methylase UbiE|nr:methyltransferase domain-containing protein [Deltaproteobacteria bacterium]MBW2531286.1 methyltransferase domain-containing protein [Deltaproteobacteria bacterium]